MDAVSVGAVGAARECEMKNTDLLVLAFVSNNPHQNI
jgi:hypothetical protein